MIQNVITDINFHLDTVHFNIIFKYMCTYLTYKLYYVVIFQFDQYFEFISNAIVCQNSTESPKHATFY